MKVHDYMFRVYFLNFMIMCIFLVKLVILSSRTPKFLNGFKCESKLKTTEKQGVRARSLVRSTLRGGGACWGSEMGL
jgi:hypothetical protein